MTKRKIKYLVLIIATASVAFIGMLYLSSRNLSSHHASINIDMSIYGDTKERIEKFENIVRTMKLWANESDMRLIEGNETISLSSFSSDRDSETREYSFKDKLSANGPMQLEVMITYDINSSRL